MTRPRGGNYLWVTWLSRLMAGEVSCTWAAWFRYEQIFERGNLAWQPASAVGSVG